MDKPYSKRELDEKFAQSDRQDVTFKQDVRESLTRIESQVSYTNGRVTKLERWQSYVIGFCACLSLLIFSIIIPLVPSLIEFLKAR